VTLRLTPDLLAAGYDFLRETTPFKGWRLPPADEVGFHVVRDPKMFADCGMEDGTLIIRVSEAKNGHTATLLSTLAHEMIHCRQFLTGDSGNHNVTFKRLAKSVCAAHGFDLKSF
jgi:hypothetical protein